MAKPGSQMTGQLRKGAELLPKRYSTTNILEYKKAAEQMEQNPNIEIAEKIKQLNGGLDRMTQLDEISAMTTGLISAMAKLAKKKGGKLNTVRRNPKMLQGELMKRGLVAKLSLTERAAIEHLPLVIGVRGDTSDYFRKAWGDIVDQAETAAGGWTEKIRSYVKKDPVRAVGMLAIGAIGVWAGWSLIKKLWSDKGKEEGPPPKKGSEAEKRSWMNKKILIPIAIAVAGAIIGREKLKKLMGGLGIEQVQELLAKGESIPEDVRKQIEEQAKKIEELELAAKAKAAVAATGTAVVGAAAGAKEKLTDEAGDAVENVERTLDVKKLSFRGVASILTMYHCYNHREFGESERTHIKEAIYHLRNKRIDELEFLLEKAKKDKSILKKELGDFGNDIDNRGLFQTLSIIVTSSKKFNNISPDETVNSLFDRFASDPTFEFNNAMHTALVNNASKGDIMGILNPDSLNQINAAIDKKKDNLIKKLDENLELDLSNLTTEEKKQFRAVQVSLYTYGGLMSNSPAMAIDLLSIKTTDRVGNKTEQYYKKIQDKLNDLLPDVKKRYGINTKPENVLDKHLVPEEIHFKHAMQLLLASDGIDLDPNKPNHELKELAMLGVILRTLDREGPGEIYIGQLAHIFIKSPTNIKLPSLKVLQPYFKKILNFGGYKLMDYWSELKNKSAALRMNLPSEEEDFNEQLRNSFFTTLTTEAGGGSLQIATDAIAPIMSAIDATPEEYAGINSAEDFARLILAKGHSFIISKDPETGKGTGLINVAGNYFVFKPWGVLKDTYNAIASGEGVWDSLGMGVKAYAVGASPFVVIGAAHGYVFRPPSVGRLRGLFGGAIKGFRFPATFAYDSARIAGKGSSAIYRAGRWTKESMQNAFHWTKSIKKFGMAGSPRKNVAIMLRDIHFAEHYYTMRQNQARGLLEKGSELVKTPGKAAKRYMFPDYIERQSQQYTIRSARRINRFFYGYLGSDAERAKIDWNSPVSQIDDAVKRGSRIKTFMAALNSHPDFAKTTSVRGMKKLIKSIGILDSQLEMPHLLKRFDGKNAAKEMQAFRVFVQEGAVMQKNLNAVVLEEIAGIKDINAQARAFERAVQKSLIRPVDLGNGKFRYMGEEFKLSEDVINSEVKKIGKKVTDAREQAIEKLCHKKWSTPAKIKDLKNGSRIYRYRGAEFTLEPTEFKGKGMKDLKKIFEVKFLSSIEVTEMKVEKIAKGVKIYKYKIGGEWIKMGETPAEIASIKKEYLEQLKKAGKPLKGLGENVGLLKKWPLLIKILGPTASAMFIYHLETAEDKREAVAESVMSFGAFYAGMKATDWAIGKRVQNPKIRLAVDLAGGLSAAFGLQGTIEELIEEYWPRFAGSQQISSELISLFEKGTVRGIAGTGMMSFAKGGLAKKGIEKLGLKGISKFLETKIRSKMLARIARFTSKSFLKKVAPSLGLRGTAALVLGPGDEYIPVVGFATDVIALGLTATMAVDVYDICVLIDKSVKIKDAMEKFDKMPIESIEPADESSKKTWEAALAMRGKSKEEMNDKEIMELIHSISDIKLRINREGATGYEEYRFVRGDVWSTTIMTETGEILELSDEELSKSITVPPPKEFQPWDIDYNAPKDKLLASYRMALLQSKSECGWTKMDYKIINDRAMEIINFDSNSVMKIIRIGKTWQVEDYKDGLTLFQAVAMANLVNEVRTKFQKENYKGGSERPFEIDGEDIDFDINNIPIDETILSEDSGWIEFYKKNNISKTTIANLLNDWYQNEYHYAYAV